MRSIAKVLFLVLAVASTGLFSTAHATDHTVLMNGDYFGAMFFDPPIIDIAPGDRVRWQNVVAIQHTATSGTECTPSGSWTTGIMNPGQTSAYVTFATVGSIEYFCRFHCEMGMTGIINVKTPTVSTRPVTWSAIKALYRATTPR